MAVFLEDEVRKTYPEFPLRQGVLELGRQFAAAE